MRLLLDTCTFLWLSADSREVSTACRDLVMDRNNEIFLSVISAWEIAIKNSLGRLPLPEPAAGYIPALREALGAASLPLDEDSALHLAKLPRLHNDPFDRMLVCQALVHGLVVLTPDTGISQYPVRCLW